MKANRCLYCYNTLQDKALDYHPECCRKFFGTEKAPILDIGINEIEALAVNILANSKSVTGVQPKLSVDLLKERKQPSRLTIVGLWGSYILKPPLRDYPQMPEIEDLTMKLAEAAGIKTAMHSLIHMKTGELAYISKRFDRTKKGKLHQEDFAQLLEVLTERKYSGSIEQIGKGILKYSSFPGNDLINLFEVVLFSFLTGNADMHLKNFSLLRDSNDDIKLSPAYDLLSTQLLISKDQEESALTISEKKSNLKRKDFDMLAERFAIQPKTLSAIYRKFSGIYDEWADLIEISFMQTDTQNRYKDLLSIRYEQIELSKGYNKK